MSVLHVFDVPRSRSRWRPRGRRWAAVSLAVVLLAPLVWRASSASAASASPDALITWDAYSTSLLVATQGQVGDVTNAMVSAAMYDAVNAIAGTPYEPYLVAPAANGTESVDAAVATAAFDLLAWLLPNRRTEIQARYDGTMAAVPAGSARDDGARVGREAATAMIAERTNDGRNDSATWPTGTKPGEWRPTPPFYTQDAAQLQDVKPFVIPSLDMFRTSGPPALTSPEYTRDFNEVKAKGASWWSTRTAEENEVASYWAGLGADHPIKRQLATSQSLDAVETARLFALADLARADGHDACYNEKGYWHFWRPITAIRQAGSDGNPNTAPNVLWSPLIGTPAFPDYPSGRACHVSAQLTAHRLFFGRDDVAFSATVGDVTRHYTSFQKAIDDVVSARVLEGIHFRSATLAGAKIGSQAAQYIFEHRLRKR